jgi:hypothetical protein
MRGKTFEMESLRSLRQKRLTSVNFVMDYIELVFEDLVLAALALPILTDSGTVLEPSRANYRDSLISKIARTVVNTSETKEQLQVSLDDGSVIVLPLDAPSPSGPEMATLSGRGTFFQSWLRPEAYDADHGPSD